MLALWAAIGILGGAPPPDPPRPGPAGPGPYPYGITYRKSKKERDEEFLARLVRELEGHLEDAAEAVEAEKPKVAKRAVHKAKNIAVRIARPDLAARYGALEARLLVLAQERFDRTQARLVAAAIDAELRRIEHDRDDEDVLLLMLS